MSAEDLQEIYLLYGNPLEKRVADIRNAQARARYQKPQKDTKLDLGSISNQRHSSIKFVNDHYNLAVHDLGTSEYFPATEPDYDKCKLIITTDHFGYKLFDDSEIPSSSPAVYPSGQDVTLYGEPKLVSGFDRGYGDSTNSKKRQALYFNRPNSPTKYKEYIKVLDQAVTDPNKSLRVTDASSGFSFFSKIKLDNFSSNGLNNETITLGYKVDDNSGDNRYMINVQVDGKVRFVVSKANVDKFRQSVGSLTTGNEFEIWTVYDPDGATDDDKLKIYLNGSIQTNEASSFGNWGSLTDHDMYIGKRGSRDGGFIEGYLIYTKFFLNYKVSAAEVSQHFTNKLTIADIAYGKVATTEYPVPRNV